jgi:hypothetical protein
MKLHHSIEESPSFVSSGVDDLGSNSLLMNFSPSHPVGGADFFGGVIGRFKHGSSFNITMNNHEPVATRFLVMKGMAFKCENYYGRISKGR